MPSMLLLVLTAVLHALAVRPPDHLSAQTHLRVHPNLTSAAWSKSDFFSHSYNVKDVQLGCKELRSKRYISDGFCTSIKPVTEVVCAGICLPISELNWYAEVVARMSSRGDTEWRCVNDTVRKKRVHLVCRNGQRRSYRIRVVRACKCKKHIKSYKT